jgi:hypothetical protein
MPRFLEELESRRLLAADLTGIQADLGQLKADSKALKAELTAVNSGANHDQGKLMGDLRKAGGSSNRTLATTLHNDVKSALTTLRNDFKALDGHGRRDLNKAIADVKVLTKKPGNAAATARLNTDLTALSNDAAGTTLGTDAASAQSTLNADLAAIGNANPSNSKLQADLAAAQADVGKLSMVSTTTSTLQADVVTLVAAVRAQF